MRKVSLCFLIIRKAGKISHVWLAMKKRGFAKGKFNGLGGKFDRKKGDKTIADTNRREPMEEGGVRIGPAEKVAIIDFIFPKGKKFTGWNQQAHVYFVSKWKGEPIESEEMKPCPFNVVDIPYGEMWDDDIFWLPAVLQGKKIRARCEFDSQCRTKSIAMRTVSSLR